MLLKAQSTYYISNIALISANTAKRKIPNIRETCQKRYLSERGRKPNI